MLQNINVEKHWYKKSFLSTLLLPLSYVYCLAVTIRRFFYKYYFVVKKVSVPVIVVGNISVGGTGKTPLVIWLVRLLQEEGLRPGIVIRGYKAVGNSNSTLANTRPDTTVVGDEAVVLVNRCNCPVLVGSDRLSGAKILAEQHDCTVIVSDDGLQHYALPRDVEIAVIDAERGFGNARCLPAGPLREPITRLKQCDYIIWNGNGDATAYNMEIKADNLVNLCDQTKQVPLQSFDIKKIHAVAGIGNPNRFFNCLKENGFSVVEHPFPDHFRFQLSDLDFKDELPVFITEKDAVKCTAFAKPNMWYVKISAQPNAEFTTSLKKVIRGLRHGQKIT